MLSTLLLASALAAVASAAAAPPNDTALVAKLITENTQVNKVADITVSTTILQASKTHIESNMIFLAPA